MPWNVHIANASGLLDGAVGRVRASLERAERRVVAVTGAFDLDVIVQNMRGRVIPELGLVGYAPTGWLVHLTLDAENDNMADHLDETLERMMAHEANHALRWRGPGYGGTLGAALISEGLAGQFTRQIYQNDPEPWEKPAPDDLAALPEVLEGWSEKYDHGTWFFGAGAHPAWLGYRLGYRIVGRHIEKTGQTAFDLTDMQADAFLTTVQELSA